jgi:flagellin
MSVINTNVSALYSQGALKTNERAMSTVMQQLSTGSRVNSAKDDAAGLAIGQTMTAQIRGLNQAVRNLNDSINMMQTAEGAMTEVSNMLQRMRELAVQSSNATYSSTQRGYLNTEFAALSSQITKVGNETLWNGTQLLATAATSFVFQAGAMAGQTVTGVLTTAITATGLGVDIGTILIDTAPRASTAITGLDAALGLVNTQRASFGAVINQMAFGADNLTNIASNTTASRSTIMDTDYAQATTQLAKNQIIQQAATAMLAQANQQPQGMMALLKG